MDLKLVILRKLYRHRIIGRKHTAIENLSKGLPKHLVGEAKSAAEDLIKEGLIKSKPTSYGLQVNLNPQKIEMISTMVEQNE